MRHARPSRRSGPCRSALFPHGKSRFGGRAPRAARLGSPSENGDEKEAGAVAASSPAVLLKWPDGLKLINGGIKYLHPGASRAAKARSEPRAGVAPGWQPQRLQGKKVKRGKKKRSTCHWMAFFTCLHL